MFSQVARKKSETRAVLRRVCCFSVFNVTGSVRLGRPVSLIIGDVLTAYWPLVSYMQLHVSYAMVTGRLQSVLATHGFSLLI